MKKFLRIVIGDNQLVYWIKLPLFLQGGCIMKGQFFWIALFLIGISWTVNTIYAYSKQLDEPVFLDHYIDTVIREDTFITFYYLTNKNDVSGVSHVNIGDVTGYVSNDEFDFDFGFELDDNDDSNIDVFTHHALRSFHIELNQDELEDLLKEGSFIFNEIEVYFTNGKIMTASIGEVIIHADLPSDNFLSEVGTSGGHNWNIHYYNVEEALALENFTVNFDNNLQDKVFVKLDSVSNPTIENPTHENILNWNETPGTDIQNVEFPYELEKDEKLYIYTQIVPEFSGILESVITFSGTTSFGKTFTIYSPFNSQEPDLDQKDVDKIIKEKVGGGNR